MTKNSIQTEGDAWFDRNHKYAEHGQIRKQLSFISQFVEPNFSVLEIGCSSGQNITTFKTHDSVQYTGVDPSIKAITAARQQYPKEKFFHTTADNLSILDNESFNLVYLSSFLYLCEIPLLSKIVSEVDRVLKNDGILVISDFYTSKHQISKIYAHNKQMKIYKFDYSKMFLGFPQYSLLEKRLWDTEFYKEYDKLYFVSVILKNNDNFINV